MLSPPSARTPRPHGGAEGGPGAHQGVAHQIESLGGRVVAQVIAGAKRHPVGYAGRADVVIKALGRQVGLKHHQVGVAMAAR